jgi:hypothetical protein
MAKFRNGNLVLTTAQSIIQGAITINEFVTSITGDSDTKVPTEGAVKDYVDTQVSGSIAAGVDTSIARYNGNSSNIHDSLVLIDNSGNITGVNSLTLSAGAAVDEFTTVLGDSNTKVPTEAAIKTYVDNATSAQIGAGIDNRIVRYDGTSDVQVSLVSIDDSGNIEFDAGGSLEPGQTTPAGTDVLGYNGYFYATKVYNAVWG